MSINLLLTGDCRTVLLGFPDNYFDAAIVDTPYELGFMGKGWDKTGIGYCVETWALVLRKMKPGAHLLAFGGSRTYHRIACAIEDAGFEIRDQIMWVYGSGFPKSLDISKAIDKAAGAEREVVGQYQPPGMEKEWNLKAAIDERTVDVFASARNLDITAPATPEAQQWAGWGTALKPAHEPICVARKPLERGLTVAQNVLKWGTGGLNVDGCRVEYAGPADFEQAKGGDSASAAGGEFLATKGGLPQSAKITPAGRWPANLLHDGSEAVGALFELAGERKLGGTTGARSGETGATYQGFSGGQPRIGYRDTGSAARFFFNTGPHEPATDLPRLIYCGKASTAERGPGNDHPCVKPQKLLRILARLITPPGGRILDHFTGSGSGPLAFTAEGFAWTAIDLDPHHTAIAARRLAAQQLAAGLYAVPFSTTAPAASTTPA